VPAHILPEAEQLCGTAVVDPEQTGGVDAAGLVEQRLGFAELFRQPREHVDRNAQPVPMHVVGEGLADGLDGCAATDAAGA
jgi:hypothetical protein